MYYTFPGEMFGRYMWRTYKGMDAIKSVFISNLQTSRYQ